MKNRFQLLILFFIFFIIKTASAQNIKFEAEVIETNDDKYIVASNNVIIDDGLGSKIYGDKLILDKKKKLHTIIGNVIYKDESIGVTIETNEIIYNESKKNIITSGLTTLKKNDLYSAKSSNIRYDLLQKKIFSDSETTINDNLGNIILIKNLKISLNNNLLIAKNVQLTDKELNKYSIKNIYYNFQEKKLIGKDVSVNENNNLSNNEYLPRVKSRSLIIENGNLKFNKSVYTSCQKRDGCPPWLIQAEEIEHNKREKLVKYKNALLKLYDVPILYFPKFFHPDPTVERQSGFLAPSISTNNSSSFLKLPYFFEISENSDFTLSPRFYDNERTILQGEYRLLTKNSNHVFDLSLNNEESFSFGNDKSMSHFFSKSTYNTNIDFFDTSKLNLEIESTSNDNYLKTFDLKSPIIDSQNTLNSKIYFEAFNDTLDLNISTEVYEDLSKTNDSDKYEFVSPNFDLTKNFDINFDGYLTMTSLGYNKLFETNINEKVLVNNLTYQSLDNINDKGIINSYEISLMLTLRIQDI
jgi:LPS-assembly protein